MLWKLSLSGLKNRLRDYVVLFSGLVIAAAIFYMFETMAANRDFLTANSTISLTVFIFTFGSVLLGIITFVYILYANSFLLAMRQKDYALLMMFGAKTRKIAQMIFIETFVIGFVATMIGALVGTGLSSVVHHLLTEQLNLTVTHFSPVNQTALLVTLLFFLVLFVIAATINALVMAKKSILTLLYANQTPNQKVRKKQWLFIEAFVGIGFLVGGYYLMAHVTTVLTNLRGGSIILAAGLIIGGTYFLFHSVIIFILALVKSSDRFALKGIHNFTYAQLSFRMQAFTRMLSMVTILLALSLGAITVGLGFRHEVALRTNQGVNYDVTINNAQNLTATDQAKIAQLKPLFTATYHQKETDQTIYYQIEEFNQTPLHSIADEMGETQKITGDLLKQDARKVRDLTRVELPQQEGKEHQFVTTAEFQALALPETELTVMNVADFFHPDTVKDIKQVVKINEAINPSLKAEGAVVFGSMNQKVTYYELFQTFFSGLQFMGFFLGLAFLTMLASCLMFKILSGAHADVSRYEMLRRIGTRRHLLQRSIQKEIGLLFLIPGVTGMIHVLFGLQLFKTLLQHPYANIWIPFGLFAALYVLYYVLTVWLYSRLVNPKELE